MGRFLFVVPPLQGHINPTLSVGRQLQAAGHDVAWLADADLIGPLLPPDVPVVPMAGQVGDEVVATVTGEGEGLRGAAALDFLWRGLLIPLAEGMLAGVEAGIDAFGPDALVVDQQALAGAVAARRRGLVWATSATTSAELVDPFALLPKVGEWVRRQLIDMQLRVGTPPEVAERGDLRFSEHLVLAFTTEALCGPVADLPWLAGDGGGRLSTRVALVGPSIAARRQGSDDGFDWAWLDRGTGPVVLVTLGTVNAAVGGRFFRATMEALDAMGARAVVVAPPDVVGAVPASALVRSRVPQLELLERVDAVVCHAGHNTVCEALAQGLPLVVAPIRDDQPVVAQQVVQAGAGVRVRFARAGADELGAALGAVLTEPSYRAAAEVVRASFAAAGGDAAAAARLVGLLA